MRESAIVFVTFLLLAAITLAARRTRRAALGRGAADWLLDGAGLIMQGVVVPLVQIALVYTLLNLAVPQARDTLRVPAPAAFLLNFVVVDYLYYWNHRLLHSSRVWAAHAVHHTPSHVDVFVASRNTLWTPLVIVYVWANGLFVFLLDDASAFVLSAAITASLDLWRHTAFGPRPGSLLHRALRPAFITPHEHRWHHSRDRFGCNFGANLALWDRLHGTYYSPDKTPERFGVASALSLPRKLLFPF